AAKVLIHEYPDDTRVKKGFGALLTKAVVESWSAPALEAQTQRETVATIVEAARPPSGALFARDKTTGEVYAVERVTEAAVMIAGPRGSTAIMPRQWAGWEWLN